MNITSRYKRVAVLGLCALGGALPVAAADTSSWTFTFDNDYFVSSDNNYTDGFGFSWVSNELQSYDEDRFIRKWGDFWSFLPFLGNEGYETYVSWSLAQEMHTPDIISDPNPSLDDQPYAGVLYLDSLFYARKDRWSHTMQLKIGIVGPSSQAGNLQREVHELIGDEIPMGWHTQLPDEPVINVGYTVAYLAAAGHLSDSVEWRVTPLANVGLGTYFTGAGVGLSGEVGWNLVNTFGGAGLRTGVNAATTVGVAPTQGWSVSLFGGLGAFGVAHYLPLDGNVFRDSRSVNSKPFVGTGTIGLNVRRRGLVLSMAITHLTDTVEHNQQDADFGSASLSWNF